ncbi:MAG: serine esterase [Proteobacteria bacterium]|jgi:phospholipase/carboxylesterase|nr:serine esterase [Pseudomonadota bacterium]
MKKRSIQFLEALSHNLTEQEAAAGQAELTVILFHGYGADAYDLRSLSEVLETGKKTRYIFPMGPLEVPIGPGWTGRAWWPIDMARIEKVAMTGQPADLSEEVPQGIDSLRGEVFTMIDGIEPDFSKIVVGGFSQGSMLATELALSAADLSKKFAGLLLFSGALVNKTQWKTKAPSAKGLRFLMTHGTQDMVLGIKGAQQLESLLASSGLKGKLVSFPGTHEIPMLAIQKANEFLASI